MPTDQTTTPTVSEARFEEAFENYRRQKFSVYGDYPIEAYTYFSAGWKAALRAMPEAQGWRPIESAPKKNWVHIDLWVSYFDGYRETAKRYANSYWLANGWTDSGGNVIEWEKKDEETGVVLEYRKVTHWMPLPAPPPQEVK